MPSQPQPQPNTELQRVLAAEGVSNFGAMLSRVAIPWLAALALDATPLEMAMLLVADVAAAALGAMLLGAWVERRGKRAVMLICDGARAGVLAVLALLAWRGAATMPLLALAAAANGVLTMAFEVARSAWMAQRVAVGERVEANARLSVATSVSETVAFALGGWLFQWLGAVVALAVDAASYVASALCLRGVREVPVAIAPMGGPMSAPMCAPISAPTSAPSAGWIARSGQACRQAARDTAAGLAVVTAHPVLRSLAVIEILMALSMSLAGTSYTIYVARDLALPTGLLGLIFAVGGVGAVIGARMAVAVPQHIGVGWAMVAGLAAVALGAACIPLATGAGLFAITLLVVHQLVGDGGHALFAVHDRTLRQTVVPAVLLARADSSIRFGGQLAQLAGALVGGLVGDALGARSALVLCAAVLCAAAVYAAWQNPVLTQ